MKNPAENPFQVGIAPPVNSNGDDRGSLSFYSKTAAEEEEKARNHNSLPFTIQNILTEIGEVFVKMVDIRNSLARTEQFSKKTHTLEKLQSRIDDINKQIFELTNYLNDLNLTQR